jgi:Ca2+-binding EF-hand superfamily protein
MLLHHGFVLVQSTHMDLASSVGRLQSAFDAMDIHRRGTIDRRDFERVLQLNGGLRDQIDLLSEQFAVSAYPAFVDYGSFMAHLRGILDEVSPGRSSEGGSPIPQFSPTPAVPVSQQQPPEPRETRAADQQRRQHPTNSRGDDRSFIDFAISSAAAVRSSSRERSAEANKSDLERTGDVPFSPPPQPRVQAAPLPKPLEKRPVAVPTPAPVPPSTPAVQCRLADVFTVIDTDADHEVAASDIAIAFAAHGIPVTQCEVEAIIESLGFEPASTIGKDTFCMAVSRLRPGVIEKIRRADTWGADIIPPRANQPAPAHPDPQPANSSMPTSRKADSDWVRMLHPAMTTTTLSGANRSATGASTAAVDTVSSCHSLRQLTPGFMRGTASTTARLHRTEPPNAVVAEPRSRPLSRSSTPDSQAGKAPGLRARPAAAANVQTSAPFAKVQLNPKPQPHRAPARESSVPSRLQTLAEVASPATETHPRPVARATPAPPSRTAPLPDRQPPAPRPAASSTFSRLSPHVPSIMSLCRAVDTTNTGLLTRRQLAGVLQAITPDLHVTQAEELLDAAARGTMCCYQQLIAAVINAAAATQDDPIAPQAAERIAGDALRVAHPPPVRAADALRDLVRDELLAVCDGDAQFVLEQFAILDAARDGYVRKADFIRALKKIFASHKTSMPTWVAQRCLKIARAPFVAESADGPRELRDAVAEAHSWLRRRGERDDVEWCSYRYLLQYLDI